MKKLVLILAVVATAAPLWAADVVIDGSGYDPGHGWTANTPSDAATMELKWDNGTRRWSVIWYTGAGAWVGNDFSSSTLKTSHVKVLKFRMYSRDDWPNAAWDGFRIGFYGFSGGVPGSLLWPTSGGGYFFKPSAAHGHVWVECDINWTCPTTGFVAAEEQFYNNPDADPWSVDDNPTFLGHSWNYYEGVWGLLNSANVDIGPYYNLMVRVQVETGYTFPGVAPSTMGRIKALYY